MTEYSNHGDIYPKTLKLKFAGKPLDITFADKEQELVFFREVRSTYTEPTSELDQLLRG